jgi:alpha,alpha-trehalase
VVTPDRVVSEVPDAHESFDHLRGVLWNRRVVVLLDFDGTLSPIVDHPSAAAPAEGMRSIVQHLSTRCPLGVISGRALDDVRRRLGVEGIWYAGSHGFEIAGPAGEHHEYDGAAESVPALDATEAEVGDRLAGFDGVVVERTRFSLSVHVRSVGADDVDDVIRVVDEAVESREALKVTSGRRVLEIRPAVAWDKGRALTWLLEHMDVGTSPFPVYVGDDRTDEDAFEVVRDVGLGIVVCSDERAGEPTAAHVSVADPGQLRSLLERIHGLSLAGEICRS